MPVPNVMKYYKYDIMENFIFPLAIFFVVVTTFTSAQGQDRSKVPGSELEKWLSKYTVYAGTNELNGCVFIIVSYSADRRVQFFDCPGNEKIKYPSSSGIGNGSARIDGDRLCETWADIYPGWEQCEEVYRIGKNQYEQLKGTKKLFLLK